MWFKENENISKDALINNEDTDLLHDGYVSLHVLTFTLWYLISWCIY